LVAIDCYNDAFLFFFTLFLFACMYLSLSFCNAIDTHLLVNCRENIVLRFAMRGNQARPCSDLGRTRGNSAPTASRQVALAAPAG
jgi:hypothetical protein